MWKKKTVDIFVNILVLLGCVNTLYLYFRWRLTANPLIMLFTAIIFFCSHCELKMCLFLACYPLLAFSCHFRQSGNCPTMRINYLTNEQQVFGYKLGEHDMLGIDWDPWVQWNLDIMKDLGTGEMCLLYRGSFSYILLWKGYRKSFIIARTSLFRGSLYRDSTVPYIQCISNPYACIAILPW